MKIIRFFTYFLNERKRMVAEISELKEKLLLKQEHINKTNAYWKGQMRGRRQGSRQYS